MAAFEFVRLRFTKEEDRKLIRLVDQFGEHDWVNVSCAMNGRTPRQCRQRYRNYLSQRRQRCPWTAKEEQLVIALYHQLGPKWVHISTFLTGRSGNDVKNRWHKKLVRGFVVTDGSSDRGSPGQLKDPERSAARPLPPVPFHVAEEAAPRVRPALSPFLQFVLN
jgi:hypothetical protein